MILVDSNILIDIVSADPQWLGWSAEHIAQHVTRDELAINQIVVAEVAAPFPSAEAFIAYAGELGISYRDFDQDAAFLAGKAFQAYRRNRGKGAPKLALPDFFIGGHAATAGATILTRDARFYRTYFPEVPLITPSEDEHD